MSDWLINKLQGDRFAELFNKSGAFRNVVDQYVKQSVSSRRPNISVDIDPKTHRPMYRVKRGSSSIYKSTLEEAIAEADNPLRTVNRYTGKLAKTAGAQPVMGHQYNAFLESLADRMGGTVIHESYNTTHAKAYQNVLDSIQYVPGKNGAIPSANGLLVPNGDTTHVLKFIPRGSSDPIELRNLLDKLKQQGIEIDYNSPTVFKRLNTLISQRAYSVYQDGTTPMRIGYYDPLQLGLSKKDIKLDKMPDMESFAGRIKGLIEQNPGIYGATHQGPLGVQQAISNVYKTAFDGQMIMPKSGLNTFIKEIDGRIESYTKKIAEAQKTGVSSSELKELRSALAGSVKAKNQLLKAQKNGGSANARWIFGDMAKGDVNIVDDKFYQRLAKKMGYDTSTKEALENLPSVLSSIHDKKTELRMTQGGLATLDMRKKVEELYAGITESSVFPGIFTDELLDESFATEKSLLFEELQTAGAKKGPLRDMVNKVLLDDPMNYANSPGELDQFLQMQTYARRVKDMLDYGVAPGSVDTLGNQFVSMYEKHLMKLRRGGRAGDTPDLAFMTRIKNGYFAEISPSEIAESSTKKGSPLGVMMNTISYDKNAGRFNMNALDAYKLHKTHGGFDNDDTFRPVLMYDTRAKRLMAFNSRQPFEMGEYAWMSADIGTMPGVPKEARDMYFERIKLLGKRNLSNADAQRINELGASIDQVLKANYHNVDVASLYEGGREFMAPKSFAITEETTQRYLQGNIATSFHQIAPDTNPLDIRKQFQALKANTRKGVFNDSIMEFRGHSFNQFDSRYFTYIAKSQEESAELIRHGADASRIKTMTEYMSSRGKTLTSTSAYEGLTHAADIQAVRAELEAQTQGALGKYVNVRTAIENMIETQLRGQDITDLNLPSIDRERIIDAVVKTGDRSIIETANEVTDDMVNTLAQWLAKKNKEGQKFGIDPYLYDTRLKGSFETKIQEALKEQGADVNDIVLPESDPRAVVAQRVKKRIEQTKMLRQEATDLMDTDISIGSQLSDFDASAEEIERAERFVNSYIDSAKELKLDEQEDLGERLGRIFESETDDDIPSIFSREEELNRRSIQFLRNEGLFEEFGDDTIRATPALDRQLLATAKYIEMNKANLKRPASGLSSGVYSSITTTSTSDGLGIGDMFFSAYNRRAHAGLLSDYNKNVMSLKDMAAQAINPEVHEGIAATAKSQAEELSRYFPEMRQYLGSEASELPFFGAMGRAAAQLPKGQILHQARQASDEVAGEVANVTMKRFNKEVFQNMMGTIKGVRAGVAGLGIFAAVGLVYGATRDRTPEDLQGPPLLPGGSAYEDYSDTQDYNSMYSSAGMGRGNFNPGVLYQVNASGNVNPTELQNRVQSIIGGGNMTSTFYQARQTGRSGKSTSKTILEDRSGY